MKIFDIECPDTLLTIRSKAKTAEDKKKSKERLKCVSVCQLFLKILKSGMLMDTERGEHTDHHRD